jgi:hypothetical protein
MLTPSHNFKGKPLEISDISYRHHIAIKLLMNKIILSILSAGVLLVTGLAAALAEGEVKHIILPPTSIEQVEEIEQESIAASVFGWVDTGETYYMFNFSIVLIEVNGIPKLFFSNNSTYLTSIIIRDQAGNEKYTTTGYRIYEFDTGRQILISGRNNEAINYGTYFTNGETISFIRREWLPDYVEKLEYLTEEQKQEILRRLEKAQTMEEVAETALLIDPNIEHWNTKIEKEFVIQSNERMGQLVEANNAIALMLKNKKMIFYEIREDADGVIRYFDIKTQKLLSFVGYENPDLEMLKLLGVESLERINRLYSNTIYSMIINQACHREILGFLKAAEVIIDGKLYYDAGLLIVAYDQLADEYKVSYDWYTAEPSSD